MQCFASRLLRASLAGVAGALIALALASGPAQAFEAQGLGWRTGAGADPDQLFLGLHGDFGEVAGSLRFIPNLELGVGDDRVHAAFNGEFHYLFSETGRWIPYLGMGLGINVAVVESGRRDDIESGPGVLLMVGLERPLHGGDHRFFGELKVGAGDSPDLKLVFGFTYFQ